MKARSNWGSTSSGDVPWDPRWVLWITVVGAGLIIYADRGKNDKEHVCEKSKEGPEQIHDVQE